MTRPVIYLHVGAMKTGTTYLQQLMVANLEALATAGVHFAGGAWPRQVRAVQELLGLDQHDPQIASLSSGAWPALVEELMAPRADGVRSIVSMEFLSFARKRHVERIGRDLAGAELHVVLTLRDTTATIPAQWQTSVTSGSQHTWAEFCEGVRRSTGPLWPARALRDSGVREFRRTQDASYILKTWGRIVPADQLHVVLVPGRPAEPDELWRRFASVLGVDPAVATEPPGFSNPSLGLASTELVRRLNLALDAPDGLPPWDYNRTVKSPLGTKILAARRAEEPRARLDLATTAFARAWNGRAHSSITAAGHPVVGDLAVDLPVETVPAAGRSPAGADVGATSEEVLAAARTAYDGLVALVERRRRRVTRLLGAHPPQPLSAEAPRWLAVDPDRPARAADVDVAVTDLTALCRTAIQLRREMLELRQADDRDDDGDSGD